MRSALGGDKEGPPNDTESSLIPDVMYTSMRAADVRDTVRKQVEVELAALHNLYEEVVQFQSQHNCVAPINSLPVEMLNMIFSYADDDLLNITHVCRHWRAIALHTPALWTSLVYKHPDAVKAFLQRSKGLSLDVCLKFGKQEPDVGILHAVGIDELPRMRSMHMSLPPSWAERFAGKVLATITPQLEELSIKEYPYPKGENPSRDPRIDPYIPPPARPWGPPLRSLRLKSVSLPFLPASPTALTNIELRNTVSEAELLLDLLEQTPLLQNLTFRGELKTSWNVWPAEIEREPVSLPHLEILEITGYFSGGTTKRFLSSLVLPEQTDIVIQSLMRWAWEFMTEIIPTYDPDAPLFPSLRGIKRLHLTWETNFMCFDAYRTDDHSLPPALEVTLNGAWRLEKDGYLVKWPIDASELETLIIQGCYKPEDGCRKGYIIKREMWAGMLAAAPALKRLQVTAVDPKTLHSFVQELAQPLCAQLEQLCLSNVHPEESFWDAVKEVVIARSPAAGGQLTKLRLHNVESATSWSASESSSMAAAGVEVIVTLVPPPREDEEDEEDKSPVSSGDEES